MGGLDNMDKEELWKCMRWIICRNVAVVSEPILGVYLLRIIFLCYPSLSYLALCRQTNGQQLWNLSICICICICIWVFVMYARCSVNVAMHRSVILPPTNTDCYTFLCWLADKTQGIMTRQIFGEDTGLCLVELGQCRAPIGGPIRNWGIKDGMRGSTQREALATQKLKMCSQTSKPSKVSNTFTWVHLWWILQSYKQHQGQQEGLPHRPHQVWHVYIE